MRQIETLSNYFKSGMRRIFSGIMLSRLSGLARDLTMAYVFGDHAMVAAFFVAFRLANIFRRFFGEGPLQSAFIPQFEELKRENVEKAYDFFQKLTFIIGGLVCAIIAMSHLGIRMTFHLWSVENREILVFIQWILPSLFFISLYGLNVSFLQCHNRFFIAHLAPIFCNAMWIIGAVALKNLPTDQAMLGVAKCVAAGSILQWMVTFFQMLRQMGAKRWTVRGLFNPEVKRLAKAFGLGMIGVGASQLNTFFDALFARSSHVSAPVYLWYASRFQQLSFALFGIAAMSTLVPIASRAIKGGEEVYARQIFSFGSRQMMFMVLPISVATCLLGFSAINLVFGRGHFTLYAVTQTAQCLAAYTIGLLPSTLIMYDSAILYAKGDFKTPTFFSISSIMVHLVLNAFFVFALGFGPIATALSTSLSAWGNCIALRFVLSPMGWKIGLQWKEWVVLVAGLLVAAFLTDQVARLFSDKLYQFLVPAAVFVTFVGLSWAIFKKSFFNNGASKASVFLVKNN